MRVVVNLLASTGNKTGIGYYTAELLRCMYEQAGADQIDLFPRAWIRWARKTWARVRPHLETQRTPKPVSVNACAASTIAPSLKSRVLASLRRKGQRLL